MDELARAQGRWRRKLNGEAFPVLERWLKRAARYHTEVPIGRRRYRVLYIGFVLCSFVVCCFYFDHRLSFEKL